MVPVVPAHCTEMMYRREELYSGNDADTQFFVWVQFYFGSTTTNTACSAEKKSCGCVSCGMAAGVVVTLMSCNQ